MRTLTLMIPGLLDVPPAAEPPVPRVPALEMLLARSGRAAGAARDPEAALLEFFGVAADGVHDVPVGAIGARAELGATDGVWMRCDPVHLRPDQAQLILFDSRAFTLAQTEANALVAELNELIAGDGSRLYAPHPQRWYLRLPQDPGIRTHAPDVVVGRNIDPFLPSGENARRWRGILNEMQMVLHASRTNVTRETQGLPTVNSVWPWGAGSAPTAATAPVDGIWVEDAFARGLAALARRPAVAAPASARDWLRQTHAGGNHLVVLDDVRQASVYRDREAWVHALMDLEVDWIAPLMTALRKGELMELTLHGGDGCSYRAGPGRLRRFWLRRRPLYAQGATQ